MQRDKYNLLAVFLPGLAREIKRINVAALVLAFVNTQAPCEALLNPTLSSGASIPPEAMMDFPPCFRFPPYFHKFF